MKWLVTGFGPFEDVPENVTGLVAPLLGEPFQILEVSYQAVDEFLESVDPDSFDAFLALGHDKRADRIRIETLGRNVIGPRPDVRGYLPSSLPSANGPETYPASLWNLIDIEDCDHWRISNDAGGYLCNYMLYRAAISFPDKLVGFLHLPAAEVVSPEEQSAGIRKLIGMAENALDAKTH